MITKNNPSLYADLFSKAEQALSKDGQGAFKNAKISDIDDYFGCMAELARIEELTDNDGKLLYDPIFTILPMSEETFNINANDRSISIPKNFHNHGVGVQGDEVAEILYFSIDRYFDAMDLAEMDIIVQWKKATDPDSSVRLSATYKKSLTYQPGKIVFGWPIDSEVTKSSGDIKFSIRFYRRVNNELIYSFSTRTETIKIQPGLAFNLSNATDEELRLLTINKNDKVRNNLRNSKPADIGYIIATPEFEGYYIYEDEMIKEANADLTYDLGPQFIIKAVIPADTDPNEYISTYGVEYSWRNTETQTDINEDSLSYIYKENTSDILNPNEIYYVVKEAADGTPYYDIYNPNVDGAVAVLYTKHSVFTPNKAGTYQALASNSDASKPGATKVISSKIWTVPHPQAPSFSYQPENKEIVIDEDSVITIIATPNDNGELTTTWHKKIAIEDAEFIDLPEVTGDNLVPTDEGYYFIKAINTKNNDSITVFSSPVWARHKASELGEIRHYVNGELVTNFSVDVGSNLEVRVDNPTYSTEVVYQWFKDGIEIDGNSSIPNRLENVGEGKYQCRIINKYKGTESAPIESEIFKV